MSSSHRTLTTAMKHNLIYFKARKNRRTKLGPASSTTSAKHPYAAEISPTCKPKHAAIHPGYLDRVVLSLLTRLGSSSRGLQIDAPSSPEGNHATAFPDPG